MCPPRFVSATSARAIGPFSANSKMSSNAVPQLLEFGKDRSVCKAGKQHHLSCCTRIATLSRLSPPCLLSGPKFIEILLDPGSVGPYPTLNMITSRSSPERAPPLQIQDQFLSLLGKLPISMIRRIVSGVFDVLACSVLSVTIPIDKLQSLVSCNLRRTSFATAAASIGLFLPLPLAYTPFTL